MPHVLFVFLDGVGLGPGGDANPLGRPALAAFAHLGGGRAWTQAAPVVDEPAHVFRPLDATLGVAGLPQSGTGQATLFTGVNAPQLAGRHYGPYPHSATRPALASRNIFHQVDALGLDAEPASAFANAYPPRFFDYVKRTDRWTVTTRCCLEAGLYIRDLDDLRGGEAVAADLTSAALRDRLGLDVPIISEEVAAGDLHRLARRHAFTLFEYYLTDKAGHSQSPGRARTVLTSLDRFLSTLLRLHDPERDLLVITSDHGNLEDLSTKSHTVNPVPLVAYGQAASAFREATDLTHVTPAIVSSLTPGAEDEAP